jgi:hypothetical protein
MLIKCLLTSHGFKSRVIQCNMYYIICFTPRAQGDSNPGGQRSPAHAGPASSCVAALLAVSLHWQFIMGTG